MVEPVHKIQCNRHDIAVFDNLWSDSDSFTNVSTLS